MNLPLHSPAADRNKAPILEVLLRVLPAHGTALEIASGTGQHVSWFAAAMPRWTWQPTDAQTGAFSSIASHVREAGVANVLPALQLDVMSPTWPSQGTAFTTKFDAIFCANMLHISPWSTCAALMQGASRHLSANGVLITYGPYLETTVGTSAGNLAFDESLRERNADWGIRNLDEVRAEASIHGLALRERYVLPSNNLLLVFRRN